MHLCTNYRAVRSVALRSLNRQRTNIVFSTLQSTGRVLTPREVSLQERILGRGDVLRRYGGGGNRPDPDDDGESGMTVGYARVGVRLATLLLVLCRGINGHDQDEASNEQAERTAALTNIFQRQQYMLWLDAPARTALIVLKDDAKPADIVKAWVHALTVASKTHRHRHHRHNNNSNNRDEVHYKEMLAMVQLTLPPADEFARTLRRLERAGWDWEIAALETGQRYRVRVASRIVPRDPRDKTCAPSSAPDGSSLPLLQSPSEKKEV